MTKIYIVRAENGGAPESYLCGAYPTKALAMKRCHELEDEDGEYCFEYVWYDIVEVDDKGGDCFTSNR